MLSYHDQINLFHITVVAPLLSYIAYRNYNGLPIAHWLTIVLAITVVGIVLYHSMRYYNRNYKGDYSMML